jgi:hypothetical protein
LLPVKALTQTVLYHRAITKRAYLNRFRREPAIGELD